MKEDEDEEERSLVEMMLDLECVINTILFKIEDRSDHLNALQEKTEENMKRLNTMILEVKGLIQMIRSKNIT